MYQGLKDMGYLIHSSGSSTVIYLRNRDDILEKIPLNGEIGVISTLKGRSYIYTLEEGMVVRHVVHGGIFRHITGDRFWGVNRSLREIKVSHYLIKNNVLTPEIIAVRHIKTGMFYRIWVISRFVPESRDLLEYLNAYKEDVITMMEKTGTFIRRIHDLGVFHPDLQVKNILVDSYSRLWILDLDKARYMNHLPRFARSMNIKRFLRSCRKRIAMGEVLLPEGWEQAFLNGYTGGMDI